MKLNIGDTIKELRLKRSITQEQLAAYLGVTPQAISRWESGNGYPDIEILPSIAEYFCITTDALLGINQTEREKRLAEIHYEIKEWEECLENLNPKEKAISAARGFAAEFPSDERIQEFLADSICSAYMWDADVNVDILKEAERIYNTLIEDTKSVDFRNRILKSLAALYSVGFKDKFKADQAISRLPKLKHCQEGIAFGIGDLKQRQEYISLLTDHLGNALVYYIINLPNGPETWDDKIRMLEWIIGLFDYIYGDNLLYNHSFIGYVYRVIATYKIAQNKHEDTLDCLEKMCEHYSLKCASKQGDKFTSVFTDQLAYPEIGDNFDDLQVHNDAWYVLKTKLVQDRYNPIRNTERFNMIVDKLTQIAE